ncbi:DUF4321 domain-containing protein [Maledivibacter halophilus]|uniref:DUF4321 domain-containing protein n=1 Tax=Maledivibacter halophilus TaxID=36842 RepID=A0A1T5KL97_9FIRM|nr:DUF4321 domain-containing protein [Maledivibacter halophilus]SKC64440.1 protein of unknown function [Maledivibacter halophilus]
MRSRNRNPWLLLLLLLVGLVIGGVIGDIFGDSIKWLGYSKSIGISPATLDLNVIQLTFGFTMNISLTSILGLIIALLIFNRL